MSNVEDVALGGKRVLHHVAGNLNALVGVLAGGRFGDADRLGRRAAAHNSKHHHQHDHDDARHHDHAALRFRVHPILLHGIPKAIVSHLKVLQSAMAGIPDIPHGASRPWYCSGPSAARPYAMRCMLVRFASGRRRLADVPPPRPQDVTRPRRVPHRRRGAARPPTNRLPHCLSRSLEKRAHLRAVAQRWAPLCLIRFSATQTGGSCKMVDPAA